MIIYKRVDAEFRKIEQLCVTLTNDPYVCRLGRGWRDGRETARVAEYRGFVRQFIRAPAS